MVISTILLYSNTILISRWFFRSWLSCINFLHVIIKMCLIVSSSWHSSHCPVGCFPKTSSVYLLWLVSSFYLIFYFESCMSPLICNTKVPFRSYLGFLPRGTLNELEWTPTWYQGTYCRSSVCKSFDPSVKIWMLSLYIYLYVLCIN